MCEHDLISFAIIFLYESFRTDVNVSRFKWSWHWIASIQFQFQNLFFPCYRYMQVFVKPFYLQKNRIALFLNLHRTVVHEAKSSCDRPNCDRISNVKTFITHNCLWPITMCETIILNSNLVVLKTLSSALDNGHQREMRIYVRSCQTNLKLSKKKENATLNQQSQFFCSFMVIHLFRFFFKFSIN